MTKKKSSEHQEEQREHQEDYHSIAGGEIPSEKEELEPVSLATFAIMMAAEARVMSIVKILFPLLERIEAGEKITEKEILDKLSSVKIGKKTAWEKLTYLREQQ